MPVLCRWFESWSSGFGGGDCHVGTSSLLAMTYSVIRRFLGNHGDGFGFSTKMALLWTNCMGNPGFSTKMAISWRDACFMPMSLIAQCLAGNFIVKPVGLVVKLCSKRSSRLLRSIRMTFGRHCEDCIPPIIPNE